MKARVVVTLKNGVLDPQGKAISSSLEALGFEGISSVRQGKIFDIELDESDREKAMNAINDYCKKLLANTVIENYTVEIIE